MFMGTYKTKIQKEVELFINTDLGDSEIVSLFKEYLLNLNELYLIDLKDFLIKYVDYLEKQQKSGNIENAIKKTKKFIKDRDDFEVLDIFHGLEL